MPDQEALDALTASLNYPMVVVTVAAGGERGGCLVGFATQCSIEPVRFLVCVSKRNHTHRVAADAEMIGLHFLSDGDLALAELFGTESGDDVDKFERCAWTLGPAGTPLLDDCPSRCAGTILDRLDAGDHTALLVEVTEAGGDPGFEPLMFRSVRHLEPGHRA